MKTGICQICQKPFKLTKSGKLHRHGYKQYLHHKTWEGYFNKITRSYYIITQQPCNGTGLMPVVLKKGK